MRLTVAVHDWDNRVADIADSIHRSPFERVVLCVEERHARWRADNVLEAVDEFRNRGIEVYLDPWGVGSLFAGEASGTPGKDAKYALRDWMDLAFDTTANGILWDEPTSDHWEDTLNFCIDTQLKHAPDMKVMLALQPERNLDKWAADPRVNELSVSTYLFDGALARSRPTTIYGVLEQWNALLPDNASVWVQTWKIPTGKEWVPDMLVAGWANKGRNINVWSWEATRTVSAIRPANPEEVWRRIMQPLTSLGRISNLA